MAPWIVAPAVALATPAAIRHEVEALGPSHGLPQSSVTDLAVLADGRLLVGTFGGAARWDGVRFVVLDPASVAGLPGARLTAVAAADGGAAWLGTQYGEIALVEGDRATVLRAYEGAGVIWDLLPLGADLWAATDAGLLRFREGAWQRFDAAPTIALAEAGGVVYAAGLGRIVRVEGDRAHTIPPPLPASVLSVAVEPGTGVVWAATSTGLAVVEGDSARQVLDRPLPGATEIHVDPAGRVWLGTREEVARLGSAAALRGGAAPEAVAFPIGSTIRALLTDPEGQLWVGTDTRGLVRVTPHDFDRFGIGQGLPDPSARVVETTGDRVVAGSGCGSLVELAGDRWEPVATDEPLGCVAALWRDPGGRLWVGHDDLVTRSGSGEPAIDVGARVLAIAGDRDGTVWVGTEGRGAFRIVAAGATVAAPPEPVRGLEARRVRAFAPAPDGAVWLALDTGVARVTGATVEVRSAADGVPADVRALLLEDDGTVIVGTYGHGLALLRPDGRVTRVRESDGLPENVASVLVDDGRGWIWANGNRGVWRVRREDLDRDAVRGGKVRAAVYPTGEGNGGSSPAGGVDRNGNLWFATIDGVVRFGPLGTEQDRPPPSAIVEDIEVDGIRYDLAGFEAPPGRRSVVVRYTAAALRTPMLTSFQYRLAPLDGAWRDAGTERVVRFGDLPPGPFAFEVRAIDGGGAAGPPARVEFTLAPWPSERPALRRAVALALILGAASAIGLWVFRVRQRTERLRGEIEQRRRAEEHYRTLFEAASDGLLLVGADGRVTDANAAASALFRRDMADLRGRPLATLITRQGDQESGIVPEGPPFPAQVSRVALDGGRTLVSIVDTGPLTALHTRLAQAERLEAIGRVAGGVAHDLNNLLMVVRATASELEEDPRAADAARQLADAVARGSELTRHLLAFGQRQALVPVPVDLGALVVRIEPILRRLLPEGVALTVDALEAGVLADPTQLELVVVQLVLQAGERAGSGGRVVVIVRRRPDASVLLVRDNGPSIPPDQLARLFEPVLAARSGTVSTAFTLASVHGFVTQSKGGVEVRSSPDRDRDPAGSRGTTFEVTLPVVQVPHGTPLPTTTPIPAAPRVAGKALVCDDDPFVRRALEKVLRSGGWKVRTVDNGPHALDALASEPADVLVTDVLMPEMSGVDLARVVRQRYPKVKVVFVSGYTRDLLPADLDGPLLKKPFEAPVLLAAVRKVMAR